MPKLENYPKLGNDPADLGCVILLGLIVLPAILSALLVSKIGLKPRTLVRIFIRIGFVNFVKM